MTRLFGALALLGALLGCSGASGPDDVTLAVELSYLERIALPPGAVAVAALRQVDAPANGPIGGVPVPARGPGEVVTQQSTAIIGSVPVTVTLRYDRNLLDPARGLVVDGWIHAEGQVLFAVPEPPRARPGSNGPVRLVLRRLRHVAFVCDDQSQPSLAFPSMGGDLAFLESTGAMPLALRARPVGSGFHYGGGGFDLRGKGNEAVLTRPTGGATRCLASRP